MKKYSYLSRLERFEMALYPWLGVQQFRKLVFLLEKVIHLKDKQTNVNYHVSRFTPSAVKDFKKYLFYNGSIHVRNIVYAVIYGVLRVVFGSQPFFLDYLVILHTLKDIYCVMLQRYNFLQIKNFQLSQEAKRKNRGAKHFANLCESFSKTYDFSERENDLRILRKIKQKLENNEPIILDDSMAETLFRLEAATRRSTTNIN